jgi:hypothetical protein
VIAYSIAVAKVSTTESQTASVAAPPISATNTSQNAAQSARR